MVQIPNCKGKTHGSDTQEPIAYVHPCSCSYNEIINPDLIKLLCLFEALLKKKHPWSHFQTPRHCIATSSNPNGFHGHHNASTANGCPDTSGHQFRPGRINLHLQKRRYVDVYIMFNVFFTKKQFGFGIWLAVLKKKIYISWWKCFFCHCVDLLLPNSSARGPYQLGLPHSGLDDLR